MPSSNTPPFVKSAVKTRWTAPASDFRSARFVVRTTGRFRGIFIPLWSFTLIILQLRQNLGVFDKLLVLGPSYTKKKKSVSYERLSDKSAKCFFAIGKFFATSPGSRRGCAPQKKTFGWFRRQIAGPINPKFPAWARLAGAFLTPPPTPPRHARHAPVAPPQSNSPQERI